MVTDQYVCRGCRKKKKCIFKYLVDFVGITLNLNLVKRYNIVIMIIKIVRNDYNIL